MKSVPLAEAKNRFSELIAAAERGDEVAITRRGVSVARLVAVQRPESADEEQRVRVAEAFARLRQIRARLSLEGDLKTIAREGLD
ncbi:MAG: type II toxin-antitoxin system Phd/YefM family antitoxin [Thauera phenolivorans]|uniref:Antitoxin n=1 Tax=Thauera phenolivorans TaxID=1792543 RepID=A0A7X7LUG9_9RHOO|nr:type II toxin-antitoxin system prevent-host-death family antitoxin [Thauera phenolivorans]NLF53046.1 type II toxin-antitoxin system Phd/YefM family antitoxin [Thauera phenolivorans]